MKMFPCKTQPLALCGMLAIGLLLTGCDKPLKMQAEAKEVGAKFDALQTESRSLEARLTELRKALPPAGSPEESVRIVQAKASGELTILEANLKAAAANLKETETAVANLKKEIAPQRSN
ncbi:MAG: hypothetical protein U0984_05540 [Prosthecobacter sp.]|nr:hypothetical protein [Prosthecobacter sp.]